MRLITEQREYAEDEYLQYIRDNDERAVKRAAASGQPTWLNHGEHGRILLLPEQYQPYRRHTTSDGTVILEYRPPCFPDDETRAAEYARRSRKLFDRMEKRRRSDSDDLH